MSLIPTPEAKKASNEEIISTMSKLSDILIARYDNDPDLDINQVFRAVLADECYSNPDAMKEPFFVDDIMIMIPTLPKTGSQRGASVVALVQVHDKEPYLAYTPDTHTWIQTQTVKLRGMRSASLHRIIPGMIVSFHHYSGGGNSDYRDRTRIDAGRIVYKDGRAVFETIPEEEALFIIPDPNKQRDIYS